MPLAAPPPLTTPIDFVYPVKYSDELKVGLALVVAALVFVLGLRYFQDLPLFETTDSYYTLVENAAGLSAGSAVRVSGVPVGAVRRIRYAPEERQVRVDFYVEKAVDITEGSHVAITGLSQLGDVKMDLTLGPPENELIAQGQLVPSREEDLFGDLAERAPTLFNRADTVLVGLDRVLGGVSRQLDEPDSDLRRTLQSVEATSSTVSRVLDAEQQRLAATLDSVAMLSASLTRLSESGEENLDTTMADVRQLIERLDRNLDSVESSTDRLDAILTKVENGEGTLGLLVNDPALYHQMDSTLTNVNRLLEDFQQNPRRYLQELKLIEIF